MAASRYENALMALAEADERVVVLTAENRAAIRTLPERLGPRFKDVGIAEQTLVGAAAGLALRGRVPVAHALAAFLTMRAFEFIRTDVGIGRLPVKLVGYVPGILSEANGPTHQALEDVSLMRGIPGMQVFSPADVEDLLLMLPTIVASPFPAYVRYVDLEPRVGHESRFVPGRAERILEGDDVAILVHGALFGEAYEAALLLSERFSVRLLNMRTLDPVDGGAIVAAAIETRLLVVVEDHFAQGGLATIAAEVLARAGLGARLLPISFESRWFAPALLPDVLSSERLDAASLAERVGAALRAREAA
jgi:transketolase